MTEDEDRKKARELLIATAENVSKEYGKKYMFSIGRNKHLIETHKKLGWVVDENPSKELIKNIEYEMRNSKSGRSWSGGLRN